MNSMENVYALYIRDRYRVTSKLTLTLGLRWEAYPTRTRSAGMGIESYDPNTNEALIGGRGDIPRDNGVGWSKKLFAPRLGFAYQLGNNTVIRSGYGITYHSHPWGAQALRGWYPLTVISEFSGVNGYQPITPSPSYVAAGVPEQAARRRCRHSSDLLPGHQHGTSTGAEFGRVGISRRKPGTETRLHPVMELHR